MTMKIKFLLSLSGILLSGCLFAPKTVGPNISEDALDQEKAFQYQLSLEQQVDTNQRVQRIGFDILRAGRSFCEEHYMTLGMQYISQQQIEQKYWTAANTLYGLASRPKVTAVFPNGPAELSGIQPLDTVIAVGDVTLATDGTAHKTFVEYLNEDRDFYQISVLRNGQQIDIIAQAEKVCNFPVSVENNDVVNAYADGNRIVINSGMVEFAREDKELALVIAHELAHNTEGHITAKKTNAIGGAIAGTLLDALLGTSNTFSRIGADIGASAHSVDFEREADYVGMYILARSGYSLTGAGKFWRRMAVKSQGKSIDFASTHPTSAHRMLAIEETSKEIEEKRQNDEPLLPNKN